jgi:mono/diheme cytochrome c family protein
MTRKNMHINRFKVVLLLSLLFTIPAFGDGAALYKQKACAQCHAADGSGNTPVGKALKARDLRSDEVQKQSDDELAATIADGREKMPAYKSSLSPEQVRELVTYIRALAKKQ